MNHYLIIGLGKIGLPVANGLAEQGCHVLAVNRSYRANLHPKIALVETDARFLNVSEFGADSENITHACIIVSPSQSSEQGYLDSYFAICENFIKVAKHLPKLERVIFISSTGIYGQNHGEIIDVDTPIEPPKSATSSILLATEQLLQQAFGKKCTIIRPSGIYGKDRVRLIRMVTNIAHGDMPLPQNSWTNRIVDTDLVNVIIKVLQEKNPLPVYIATDFEPVAMYDVLSLIAKNLNVTLTLTSQLPNTGKRLISNLPKNWLNYPNYHVGYQYILQCNP